MKLKTKPTTRNEKSVVALAKLLTSIANNPENFLGDDELLSALRSPVRGSRLIA